MQFNSSHRSCKIPGRLFIFIVKFISHHSKGNQDDKKQAIKQLKNIYNIFLKIQNQVQTGIGLLKAVLEKRLIQVLNTAPGSNLATAFWTSLSF